MLLVVVVICFLNSVRLASLVHTDHQLEGYSDNFSEYVRRQNATLKHFILSSTGNEFQQSQSNKQAGASLSQSPFSVKDKVVDCSSLSLETIHPSWFPSDARVILLNNNHLKSLVDFSFAHVSTLTDLDVSSNEISHLEPGAFLGLTHLASLNLNYNRLCLNTKHISEETFSDLTNLKVLNVIQDTDIRDCNVSHTYLEPLRKLQRLSIGANEEVLYFGSEFRSLTNLEALQVTGSTQVINDKTFENLGAIKELYLKDMNNLFNMSSSVFVPLTHLLSLKMENVLVDVQYVLSLLKPFVGKNMTEIYFNMVSTTQEKATPNKNGILTRKDTNYLLQICVRSFTLINSYISYISMNAFGYSSVWSDCLYNLLVSDNPLQGSSAAIFPMTKYTRLETITIEKALRSCDRFHDFRYSKKEAGLDILRKRRETAGLEDRFVMNVTGDDRFTSDAGDPNFLIFKLPLSLRSLQMSRLVSSADLDVNLLFLGASNVEYLDVSDNGFKTFVGNIQGLHSLRTAVVSLNDMSELKDSFFDGFFGLEKLFLSKCELQRDFMSLHSSRVFKNLSNLQGLDLSYNYLNDLSQGTFYYNSKLVWLNLSDNQFNRIPFDLTDTPNLLELDVRNNAISTLSKSITDKLDQLALRNGKLNLKLSGNFLSCGCQDFNFLHWLSSTLVSLDQGGNFTCMDRNGERSYTMRYSQVDTLWRLCWGQYFLYVAIIIFCFYVIGVFLLVLVHRNKTFLVSFFLQLLGNFKLLKRGDYTIDVFVGYSDEDYRFPCRDLRLYLEDVLKLKTFLNDRDLLASLNKASGIVDAINSSYRILLLCSESFLKDDDWSLFTVRAAMYAQSPANPSRVVIMVHESCLHLLPTELLSVVNEENILVVSGWKLSYETTEMLRTRLQ